MKMAQASSPMVLKTLQIRLALCRDTIPRVSCQMLGSDTLFIQINRGGGNASHVLKMMFFRQNLILCPKANFDGIWSQKMVVVVVGGY